MALHRRIPNLAAILIALIVVASALVSIPTSQAAPGPATSAAAGPRTYTNPLDLRVPGQGQAASCADPDVFRDRDGWWYLYCTTDALTETPGADGELVFHTLPIFRSHDLVDWTYVGDAQTTNPSWVAPTAGLWAPDVVHRHGRYYLYYAASDTRTSESTSGGGAAIGVLVADSPTGPWTDSGGPVVAPSDQAGQPGTKRSTIDPEVLVAGDTSYLYFGSYSGGIFVRQLSSDGLHSSHEKQIAVSDRYEGAYLTRHGGWYYLLASATNCCNGPLTGYSVFAARSRSPLGPFVDADGISTMAGRVGGTPVLTQNGNRWVGTGHNTGFTDYSGQDWLIYHAVNRNDPYYAGSVGYTKRPALLDPLDWRHGWPVVRGGFGPSDDAMPVPAARPGGRTAYRPVFFSEPEPGRAIVSATDSFSGTDLSPAWSWVRPPASSTYRVRGGELRWQTQDADLHPPTTPLASVLTRSAPRGNYLVQVKVATNVPASGCCHNYVQGGLLIYGGDGHYVKLAVSSIGAARQTEWGIEDHPVPSGYPSYGNAVVGPVGAWTWLRIVVRGDRYTAYTSLDGRHWDHGATWTTDLGGAPKLGLISMGGAGFLSRFDDLKTARLEH